MAYDREYTVGDIVRILNASENRLRPDITSGTGPCGHAIAMHTNERRDKFGRAGRIPGKDSTFLVERTGLASILHEAFNSSLGQRNLAKLNSPGQKYVKFTAVVLRRGANFDIFTVYRPPKGGQTSFDWLSVTKGDGFIVEVFVSIFKIPNCPNNDIHIQTAFAKDFARTDGEEIVRPKIQ